MDRRNSRTPRRTARVSRRCHSTLSLDARPLRFEALEGRRLLAVFSVSNLNDSGTGSLRDAITMANNAPGADEVQFATTGTIGLTTGELLISDTLTVTGPGQELLTIDAQQNSRVFHFSRFRGNLTLSGLAVTGGRSADSGGGIRFNSNGTVTLTSSTVSGNSTTSLGARGGGIYAYSGSVSLTNSTVSGNSTTGTDAAGGGIYAYSGSVSLTSSTVSGNSTTGTDAAGGGIYTYSGSVSLTSSTVSGNSTTGTDAPGGGIYTYAGSVSLTSSTVSGNSTTGANAAGGGIYTYFGSVSQTSSTVSGNSTTGANAAGGGIYTYSGSVSLTSSTVSGNSTTGINAAGGGIYTYSGSVSQTSSTVSGNSTTGANAAGGGIYTYSGSVSLTSSTVSGNSTTGINAAGGGIYTYSGSGSVSLTSSTVSGNSTTGTNASGGGIITFLGNVSLTSSTVSGNSTTGTNASGGGVITFLGNVSLTSSTVSGNKAGGFGGGVLGGSSIYNPLLTIENSIVADNTAGNAGPDLFPAPTGALTINHSLIGVADGLTIIGNTGNLTGTAASPLDPLLGPLADNGGPTKTHALLPDSPAIDAGNPTIVQDPSQFDQRGDPFLRVAGGDQLTVIVIDMGAYEAQGPPSADFDSDNDVDGSDFLAWQRGYGTTVGANKPDGNSDDDGDVDNSDRAAWEVSFGKASLPLASPLLAVSDQSSAPPWQPVVASAAQVPTLHLRTELRGAALALVIAGQQGLRRESEVIHDGLHLETPYEAAYGLGDPFPPNRVSNVDTPSITNPDEAGEREGDGGLEEAVDRALERVFR